MAGDTNVYFIFKLCAIIIIATSLNSSRVKNGIATVAQILVEPRRDINASQCFVDTNSSGVIYLQGSVMETCIVQFSVPVGTHVQLQLPGRNKT